MSGCMVGNLWRPLGGGRKQCGSSTRLACCPAISNDHTRIWRERTGYKGISIPAAQADGMPGATRRTIRVLHERTKPLPVTGGGETLVPIVNEIICAALDERIESGRIDFVDDLANVVPAVLTLAMMGIPLKKWEMYSEPTHAAFHTPEHSPDAGRQGR